MVKRLCLTCRTDQPAIQFHGAKCYPCYNQQRKRERILNSFAKGKCTWCNHRGKLISTRKDLPLLCHKCRATLSVIRWGGVEQIERVAKAYQNFLDTP